MEAFWDAAQFAKRSIAPSQSPEAAAHMLGELRRLVSSRPDAAGIASLMAGIRFDLNLSNLGDLPVETRFGGLTLDSVWGPSILAGFVGEQQIGIATVNGALRLLHTSHEPLPFLLAAMEEALGAACS